MRKSMLVVGTTPLLFAALCLTGCAAPYRPVVYPIGPLTIKTTELPDGSTQSWEVDGGWSQPPILQMRESQVRKVARLGIKGPSFADLAGNDGSTQEGLPISEVIAGSPADRAGLVEGDLLLQVDGKSVTSIYQLRQHMDELPHFDQAVELTVHSMHQEETPDQATNARQVQIVPEPVEVTETEVDSMALRPSVGVQHYTGLQAATVPAEVAKNIYGSDGSVLLVTGVVCGSPAYYAGLRAGDRVLSIDGGPATLDDLRVAVYDRLLDEAEFLLPTDDLLMFDDEHRFASGGPVSSPLTVKFLLEANDQRASDDAPMLLEVDGPLGPHRAELPLAIEDIDNVTRTNLPGILTSRSTVGGTGVQFLDPGFTIGFDYRSYAT
ncbi:MAG: PDZ domain-containing protein, partial [Planctomycetota bacterium]|nr:PDZ domain-containing protein [Planctomycetota bacterium]